MRPLAAVIAVAFALSGCARREPVTARTFQGEPIPDIPISPGFAERLAVMDRFRLHDEMRKHMMARPHVWVEELSDEEAKSFEPEAEPPSDEPETAPGDEAEVTPDAGTLADALDAAP